MKLRFVLGYLGIFFAIGATRLCGQIITDFTPTLGSPGDAITINGNGFASTDKVYFDNGQSAWVLASATVTSGNQIQATVPAGIITGPIGVRIGTGTTSCGFGGFNCSPGDFTVVGPGPYISGVSPNLGAAGDSVTISGVHFTGATSVKFNGTNASFSADASGTQIFANVPGGASTGPVTVTSPAGTATSPSAFTVIGPGPYISDFSPTVGVSNTTVIINGRHFIGATNVAFNGTAAGSFFVTADSQIRAVTPAGVTTGFIKVQTPVGTFLTTSNFFVPPGINSFSPGTGQAGGSVTVPGKNFKGATAVSINGGAASYSIVNNTNISATVPGGVNSGLVRVTAPAGSAFSSSNFRFLPSVAGFSPGSGSAGATVTITGANLNEGLSAVKFNGVSATFATPAFGSVNVTVPAATSGTISLTTSNGTATSANNFYFPASISSFTPTAGGGGASVTIKGQNFTGASSVTFNNVGASFFVNNNTNISAVAPGSVSSGTIKVTTPAGTATSAALFYAPPTISGFAPTHGVVGTTVTISGNNFLGASAVQFNGTNAGSFTVLNNNSIQAMVPAGAQTGPIKVTAPAGSFTTSTNFVPDYQSDLQVTITDAPDPVRVGSNLVYTIYVQNNGPDSAPNVLVSNYLPATVVLKGAGQSQGTMSTNGNVIVASMGTIGYLGVATMALTVTPTNAGLIYDSVNGVSGYVDPVGSNSVASAITTVEPLPLLAIRQMTSNRVRVSWALGLSNYSLQYKGDLPTNNPWISNSAVPVLTNNEEVIIEPATNSRRFYRLFR